MKIGFIGDIHGNYQYLKFAVDELIKRGCEYTIGTGDFGVGFGEERLLNNCGLDATILGNHDKQDAHGYCGDWVDRGLSSVKQLRRGEVLNLNNTTLMCFGGAESIDKHMRIKDYSWWAGETITKEFAKTVYIPPKVDIVVAHTMPMYITTEYALARGIYRLKTNFNKTDLALNIICDRLAENNEAKSVLWLCSHWHDSYSVFSHGIRFEMLDRDGYFKDNLLIYDSDSRKVERPFSLKESLSKTSIV